MIFGYLFPPRLILVFCFLCSFSIGYGQKFDWAKHFVSDGHTYAGALDLDPSGNVILNISIGNSVSTSSNTVDIDPGPSVVTVTKRGFWDHVVAKFDPQGNLLWYFHIGDSLSYGLINKLKVNSSGEIYTLGYVAGSVDYDPGPGTAILSNSNTITNIVLAKYDANGNYLWAKKMNGALDADAKSLALDDSGNVIICGKFLGSVDFDPNAGSFLLNSSTTATDGFLAKYDSNGNLLFAYDFGVSQNDECLSVTLDSSNDIICTGTFRGTVDFNPGTAVNSLTASSGSEAFILKLKNDGSFSWVKKYGGSGGGTFPLEVKTDRSKNIITAGHFKGTVNLATAPGSFPASTNANWANIYTQKLDSSGNFLWASQFGGVDSDYLGGISIDSLMNIYMGGSAQGIIDLDRGAGVFNLPSDPYFSQQYIFIAKFDSLGKVVWAKDIRGNGGYDLGHDIYAKNDGQVYTIATFTDSVDVNTDSGFLYFQTTNLSTYFHHIVPCTQTFDTIVVSNCGPYLSPSGKYVWSSSGTYTDILTNSTGCDSIVQVQLTITSYPSKTVAVSGCYSYTSPYSGLTYTQSGTYNEYAFDALGCDTAIQLIVTLHVSYVSFMKVICNEYTSPSGLYTWNQPGYYRDTLTNSYGCDSVLLIHLILNYDIHDTLNVSSCESYLSPSGLYTWTQSGVYHDTTQTINGCDRFTTINLTILQPTSDIISVNACDSYTSPSGNHLWTQSGTYTDLLTNASGCDSVLTINLVIRHSSSSSVNAASCGAYVSPSGLYTWTQSGIYHDTLTNSQGCDSVITVNLTVYQTTYGQITTTACGTYVSPSGNYSWSQSGIYSDTLTNSGGCDSILEIHLTVIHVNTDVQFLSDVSLKALVDVTENLCVYQWYNCPSGLPVVWANQQVFNPLINGNYQVVVSYEGCTDTSECVSVISLGVDKTTSSLIEIYPNPSTGKFTIYHPLGNKDESIRIYSVVGELILTADMEKEETLVDLSNHPDGLYHIKIGQTTFRLIKQ
jgi:hypothetical protein